MKTKVLHLIVLSALLAGCHREHAVPTPRHVVRIATAAPPDPARDRTKAEYIAMLKGDVETELGFKVGGILERLGPGDFAGDWQEGVSVAKGELLGRLKQEDFLSSQKSAFAKAEMDRQQHARELRLRATGAVSQQELEAAAASLQASEASLAVAEQALRDAVLRMPYDGTIVARSANSGETLGAGRVVLKVADLRQMSVELGIPDRLIGRVQVGREFPVTVAGLEGSRFVGRVSEVGVAAKEGARLFRVVIKVPNPEGVLRSGMTASVVLESPTEAPAGALLIPLSALVSASQAEHPDQLAVFVVDREGRARERQVRTDDLVRSSVLVTAGLRAGDQVVTAGASTLYDGALVDARVEEHP